LSSLRGISHVHSAFSFDGKVEIAQLHAFFASHGFDFVLMSEHIEDLDLPRMQEIYDACQQVSNQQCVLIPGIEIDELHILIFGVDRPRSYDGLLSFAQDCHRRGAFIVLSHPVKIRKGIPADVLPMLAGVEIWNTRYDSRRSPRPANQTLFHQLRQDTPGLVAVCGMDFHNYSDFSNVSLEVEAPSREPDAILESIRGGRVQICNYGKAIPIYDAPAGLLRRARSRTATAFYDGCIAIYQTLKRLGFRVPAPIRRGFKRIL
jgi:hypothetical protein